MPNNILLALDESTYSMNVVKYVAQTIKPANAHITILSIVPETSAGSMDHLTSAHAVHPLFQNQLQKLKGEREQQRKLLEFVVTTAKNILLEAGVPEKNISVQLREKKIGIARDIIMEAQEGDYDTLVLGRRGVSGVEKFLFGSISNKVLNAVQDCTVWIVDQK
jgi:nucleotide-binding universal stress UspA family protein